MIIRFLPPEYLMKAIGFCWAGKQSCLVMRSVRTAKSCPLDTHAAHPSIHTAYAHTQAHTQTHTTQALQTGSLPLRADVISYTVANLTLISPKHAFWVINDQSSALIYPPEIYKNTHFTHTWHNKQLCTDIEATHSFLWANTQMFMGISLTSDTGRVLLKLTLEMKRYENFTSLL